MLDPNRHSVLELDPGRIAGQASSGVISSPISATACACGDADPRVAGIRGESLIINLPGKPSAIADCLDAVFPAVPYCIELIDGPYLETDEKVVKAFRPKAKPAG